MTILLLKLPTEAYSGELRRHPPSVASQAGIRERLMRSCKRVLYTILGLCRLTAEVLIATFCLVDQATYSRPLTPINAKPSDMTASLPNHFLLGNQVSSTPSFIGVDELDHSNW